MNAYEVCPWIFNEEMLAGYADPDADPDAT